MDSHLQWQPSTNTAKVSVALHYKVDRTEQVMQGCNSHLSLIFHVDDDDLKKRKTVLWFPW